MLNNYFVQFLLGGFIVAGMSFLATKFHPRYAALLYAIPIGFTLAAIFIYQQGSIETIKQLTASTVYSVMLLLLFVLLVYFLVQRLSFWTSMTIGYIVFFLGSILYIKFL